MSLELLGQIHGWVFAVVVAGVIALEWLSPLRRRPDQIYPRWLTNIGLYLLGGYLTLLILPAGLLFVIADQPPRGLVAADLPLWLAIPLTALIVDGWQYLTHRCYHQIPMLWRVHLVHHSDTHVDITTANRHHPLESVVALSGTLALTVVLGLPAEAVAAYLILSLVISLLSHANIDLPPTLDRALRKIFVTPSVHAIHHSEYQPETDSNYGTVFTIWDRIFGTYKQPQHTRDLVFGLEYFRGDTDNNLPHALLQPFIFNRTQPNSTSPARIPELVLACITGLVIVSLALWPTAARMVDIWMEREQWQYAFLVLPVFVFLVGWEYRDELLRETLKPGWSGLWLAIPAALISLASEILDINIGRQFGLALFYQAVLLATLGWRVYLKYLPLCALLLLMVPYEDLVMPALRAATLWSVELFCSVAGFPYTADGYSFTVGDNRYAIVPACAGMSFFTLAVFLGYSFAVTVHRRLRPIAGLTLACAVVAIVANHFRVNVIITADWLRGTKADLVQHSPYEWLAFGVMFALIVLLVLSVQKQTFTTRHGASANTAELGERSGTWWAPAATASVAVLIGLNLSGFNTATSRKVTDLPPFSPPARLGKLQARGSASDWSVQPGTAIAYSSLGYSGQYSELSVIAAVPLSAVTKLVPGDIRPDDYRTWSRSHSSTREACLPLRCISYAHYAWKLKDTDEVYNVYVSYVTREELTASTFDIRLNRGLDKLRGAADDAYMIAIVSDDPIKDPATVGQQLIAASSTMQVAAN